MIDGRGILRYSRDVQRDRRTGKDNFLCKFADAFSPCEGIETSLLPVFLKRFLMHLARVRVLKPVASCSFMFAIPDAFSPCEGIETLLILIKYVY